MHAARRFILPGLCLLAAGLVLGPALPGTYLLTDDYALLLHFDPDVALVAGRPLAALQQWAVADLAGGRLAPVPWLRLSSLLLAACVVLGTALFLEKSGCDRGWSWLMGLALLGLPGMGLYVAWLAAGHYLIALLAALGAARLALPPQGHPSPGRILAAGLCLLAALGANQAGAMFYWSLMLAAMAGQAARGLWRPRDFLAPLVLGLAAMALFLGLYRLGLAFLPVRFERADLAARWPEKIVWFAREVLPNALNLAGIEPETWRTLTVAGVVAAGLVAAGWRHPAVQRAGLALAVAGLPLTMAPSLLVAESWASYRTTLPLAAALFWLLLLAIRALGDRVDRGGRLLAGALALAVLFWAASQQIANIRQGVVAPQAAQLSVLRAALRAAPGARAVTLVLCPPDAPNPLPLARYDEFGARETVHAWAADPFVRFALALEGRTGVTASTAPGAPAGLPPDMPPDMPPDALLVDGQSLVARAAARLDSRP